MAVTQSKVRMMNEVRAPAAKICALLAKAVSYIRQRREVEPAVGLLLLVVELPNQSRRQLLLSVPNELSRVKSKHFCSLFRTQSDLALL
jgi:hypothetical protein